MKQQSKKTQRAKEILNEFVGSEDADKDLSKGISNKIRKLIAILNKEAEEKKQSELPKVIIFVKDRVVAHYLQKILVQMTEYQKENGLNAEYLDPKYIVAVAMSPKGKNLLNKAYSSFKNRINTQNSQVLVNDSFEEESK